MISTMNGCEKKELEEISFTSVAIDSIKTLLFLFSARWCVRASVATSGVTRQHSRERERENSKDERARRVRVCVREPIRSVFFSGLSRFLRPHTHKRPKMHERTGPFLLFSRSQKKTPTPRSKNRASSFVLTYSRTFSTVGWSHWRALHNCAHAHLLVEVVE